MTQNELIELRKLLAKYYSGFPGHSGSLYGREMDKAVASDLFNATFAYSGAAATADALAGEPPRPLPDFVGITDLVS